MEPTTRLYAKSLSLDDLAEQISGDEAALGPLNALGHTAAKSAATFTPDMAPDEGITLVPIVGDTEIVPPGKTKVCAGYVWIINQPAHVLAVR